MDIEKKVNSIFESVIKDLLNGKYNLLEKGEHKSKLEYGENMLEIWTANGADYCKIYSKVNGLEFPEFEDEVKKIVYKLAITETSYVIKAKLKKARKEHRDSYLKYKNTIKDIKDLKVQLSSFEN